MWSAGILARERHSAIITRDSERFSPCLCVSVVDFAFEASTWRAHIPAGAPWKTGPLGPRYLFTPIRALALAESKNYDAFNFSANFFSSFASFGEITNMQYGCREFSL